jgi:hypothetical protein
MEFDGRKGREIALVSEEPLRKRQRFFSKK